MKDFFLIWEVLERICENPGGHGPPASPFANAMPSSANIQALE